MNDKPKYKRSIRSFVRREGRMNKAQNRALEKLWPIYGVDTSLGVLDLPQLFGRQGPCVLEIGFGMGHSLAQMAAENPDTNYLGVEVFRTGIATLMLAVESKKLTNVRLIEGDAKEILVHCIADGTLNGIQIFFPDPWPKKRHHKRRLVQPAFVELMANKLQVGGRLHMSTDWEDYAQQMLDVMANVASLVPVEDKDLQHTYVTERPLTKYEQRGKRLGHNIWDFVFIKQG